ncbi:glycerol-3-phosphate acyltransferase 3-like [Penaeus japonicus]|uniref:glycerol-3-phosphate acyltransferase 3-like n=1 Tax=Penaeus japonicus TaxID=27405 RepID=UPI001C70FF53|nr:glycerol-3-phosphate acyltransferase 3-like [Penaeus japonicus]
MWNPEALRQWWEYLSLHSVWEALVPDVVWAAVGPFVIWGQVLVFFFLFLVATVGRRLKLRRKYVELLEGVFQFASVKLEEPEDSEGQEEGQEEGLVICPESPRAGSTSPTGKFEFQDSLPYIVAGMRAVVQDCVSKSFSSAELRTWNMLSRTKRQRYLRLSPSLTVFWMWGFVIRWVFLMPVRVLLLAMSLSTLVVLCLAVGFLPESDFKKRVNAWVVSWCFDFVAGSLSVVARFHNKENRPSHGIAVANHTSPIDSMVLATDKCYDMVGQRSKGILGVFMRALARSSSHIWFERTQSKERSQVAQMIQDHAQDTTKPPILIFPEGICVNNTAVMQFKKGAFEIDSVVFPIAIRFDPRYGDPFWYQDSFGVYLFSMMTSWAIVCDVWYLPPMRRGENESATAFASRVKALIAHRGGFVQLAWDGSIKLAQKGSALWQKKQTQWKNKQQVEFARHLSVGEDEDPNPEEEKAEEENKEEGMERDSKENVLGEGKKEV